MGLGPSLEHAQVAQLVEHATENRSVGGSIPPLGTILVFALVLRHPLTPISPAYSRNATVAERELWFSGRGAADDAHSWLRPLQGGMQR